MQTFVGLSILSGVFSALYPNIDKGIQKRYFGDNAFNYGIFSWWMGALITFLLVIVLSLPPMRKFVPGFSGLKLPSPVLWPYFIGFIVLSALTGIIYFLTLRFPLGSIYTGVLRNVELVWVETLSILSPPIGLGESLGLAQWSGLFLILVGAILTALPSQEGRGERRKMQWHDFLFLLIAYILIYDLALAGWDILVRKMLDQGVEPLSLRVWTFCSGAIGMTVGTWLLASLFLRLEITFRFLGLWKGSVDLPSLHTIRTYAKKKKVLSLNVLMHLLVFVYVITFYYAQHGPSAGPLSVIKPYQIGTGSILVWVVAGLIGWLWPDFFCQERISLKTFFVRNWWKFVGSLITAFGLVMFYLYTP